jgi:hypothetical protein
MRRLGRRLRLDRWLCRFDKTAFGRFCFWVTCFSTPAPTLLDRVVRTHYTEFMKTAVIPQVRVEPELRADLDAVLLPGETLTEFVEASVRRAVEYRRVQTDFAARCDASLAAYERTGVAIPSDQVLSKLEAKVAARVKQLRK